MTETFYDALGIDPDATVEEIETAYRRKVKETHPDVSDASDAEERFKRVKRAKEVLTDVDKRARYDDIGHEQYVGYVNGVVDGAQYYDQGTTDDQSTATDRSPGAEQTTTGGQTTGRTTSAGGTTGDPFGWEETATSETGTGHSNGVDSESTTDNAGTAGWQQSSGGESVYATRREYAERSIDAFRVPLTPESLIQIGTMFLLYPVFVLASVLPLFPLSVNVVVALCTLFVIAYLLSIPEIAMVVFGAWSLLTPVVFVSLPGLSLFTLYGTLALVACLFPFGLAVLTRSALRR